MTAHTAQTILVRLFAKHFRDVLTAHDAQLLYRERYTARKRRDRAKLRRARYAREITATNEYKMATKV